MSDLLLHTSARRNSAVSCLFNPLSSATCRFQVINQSQVKGKLSDSITSRLVGEVRRSGQHHRYFGREEKLTTFIMVARAKWAAS